MAPRTKHTKPIVRVSGQEHLMGNFRPLPCLWVRISDALYRARLFDEAHEFYDRVKDFVHEAPDAWSRTMLIGSEYVELR